MAKKAFEVFSETMYYVLMSFISGEKCGIEIAQFIEERTKGRITIGPGTLYTLLSKFEEEKMIEETEVIGRKRIYKITDKGRQMYKDEWNRLRMCVIDGEKEANHEI
ncbi:MAG: helix-turn-helix transcriptional regulator [Clostridia bacterium]|nr:helix-turn-helix transcriptional regulator [Clostridia bacterium]MBQ7093311.1 helix-turn-helix transcriptional regulator [Clostridia bacterium]